VHDLPQDIFRPARASARLHANQFGQALVCLHHLVEGVSVRATMRLTGTNRNTILDLLAFIWRTVRALLEDGFKAPGCDGQCDEIWGFVGCKEKTRQYKGKGEEFGDAWCSRRSSGQQVDSRWHLGKAFYARHLRLRGETRQGNIRPVSGDYRRLCAYKAAIPATLPEIDFATLVKMYGKRQTKALLPPTVLDTVTTRQKRQPGPGARLQRRISNGRTYGSDAEPENDRLTNAFSKKWPTTARPLPCTSRTITSAGRTKTLTEMQARKQRGNGSRA